MKRFLIVAACFFVVVSFFSTAYADIGFKGGITFAKWSGGNWENINEFSWKKGAELGAYYNFKVYKLLSLQPEIFYSMKGAKHLFVGHDLEERWSLNYIDISVLSKLTIETGEPFKPIVFIGPYLGYLVNTKKGIKSGEESMSADLPDDIFKSTDMGLIFGGGFDFELDTVTYTLEARYSMGLTEVASEEENSNIKNQTFTILGSIMF